MDADTLFRKQTIRKLARHFIGHRHGKKQVGAVAGHVKVGNRRNILTAWQSLEYISGICVTRMAEQMMDAIGIVPGACSAWRRSALEEIGGFSEDTLAEDADATMTSAAARLRRPQREPRHRRHRGPGNHCAAGSSSGSAGRSATSRCCGSTGPCSSGPSTGCWACCHVPYSIAQLLLNLVFLPFLIITAGLSVGAGDWHAIALFAAIMSGHAHAHRDHRP